MENNTLSASFIDFRNRQEAQSTLVSKFIKWSERLQPHRVMMLAGFLLFHGNVTIPVTMYSMHLSGAGELQFLIMTVFTMIIVVSNLSAQPTKITLPAFVVGTIAHFSLIAVNLFSIL